MLSLRSINYNATVTFWHGIEEHSDFIICAYGMSCHVHYLNAGDKILPVTVTFMVPEGLFIVAY